MSAPSTKSKRNISPIPLSWEPEIGWLILLPSQTPNVTEAGIELPDSFTQKQNSGVCVRVSESPLDEYLERLIGRECLFPSNQEYRIKDSETDQLYYIVPAQQIIISRIPPKRAQFVRVLSEEEEKKDVAKT